MLRDLVMDAVTHLRECMMMSAALLPALFAGAFYLKKSGLKADSRIKALVICSAVALIFVLIPVNAAVLRILTGTYYDAPDIWNTIPLIPLGAVCTAALFGTLLSESVGSEEEITGKKDQAVSEKNSGFKKDQAASRNPFDKTVFALILFFAAVLLCGSLGTARSGSSESEDISENDRKIAEFAAEKRLIGGDYPVILATDDIIAYLHTYSPDVRTLYGRDMWDGRLTKNRYGTYSDMLVQIHSDMLRIEAGETDIAPQVCLRAFEAGADMIILPGCDPVTLKDAGYNVVGFSVGEDVPLYSIVSVSDGRLP